MKTRYFILIGFIISFYLGFRMTLWLVKLRMEHLDMQGLGGFLTTITTTLQFILTHGAVFSAIAVLGWLIARRKGNTEVETGFKLCAALMLLYWIAGGVMELVK